MKKLVLRWVKKLVLWWIRETPLNKMGDFFLSLAKRVDEHRKKNKGYVPLEIFESCVALGGHYLCHEIVVSVVDDSGKFIGFALKKRSGADETSWKGQFQIVGVSTRPTDGPDEVFRRLQQEIFGKEAGHYDKEALNHLGMEVHNEPERHVTCWTNVWMLKIRKLDGFSGEWKIFADTDNLSIVDHHRRTLEWAKNLSRPFLTDLR